MGMDTLLMVKARTINLVIAVALVAVPPASASVSDVEQRTTCMA